MKYIILVITDGGVNIQVGKEEVERLHRETGATIFVYWLGNTSPEALSNIADYQLVDHGQSQAALASYLADGLLIISMRSRAEAGRLSRPVWAP